MLTSLCLTLKLYPFFFLASDQWQLWFTESNNSIVEYYKLAVSGVFMQRACTQVNKSPVDNFSFGQTFPRENSLLLVLWLCRE